MHRSDIPLTQDLVMIGGGHAHALVLRKWGMNPLPGARLTVINPGPTAPYTGMLPGHIAGHYSRETLEIDLVRLCRFAGARLILSHATQIDREQRLIHVDGRPPVAYDVASFDIGITATMDIPGFATFGVGAKPLDAYARRWRDFLSAVEQGDTAPEVAVIGGGVAGCELSLAMAHALRAKNIQPRVTLLHSGPSLSGLGNLARQRIEAKLRRADIDIYTDVRVTKIAADHVALHDGKKIPSRLTVGAAGAVPHSWLSQTDLPLSDGFIETTPDLSIRDDPSVFAVGDCAAMPFAPRPKAGVFAVRAAPVLFHNLRAALTNGPRKPFKPQKGYLKLISLGEKSALAEKFGLALSGPMLWRWKDRIDRAFMKKLDDLPRPRPAALPDLVATGAREVLGSKPLCGGCGAKIGNTVLNDGLSLLQHPTDDTILSTPGDDAAVLRQPGGGFQVISTDHLRALIHDPAEMARIAAVHALGDIWAMGAQPQAALSSIILPHMSPALQSRTLGEITAAANDVFSRAGATIVGGHTTMGAEMTIGFTVTGTCTSSPISLSGAQAGDVLVLTQPIGSGVLMAAHMEGSARGADVAQVLAEMTQLQDRQAFHLRHAHSMTDVTGFGLAGHIAAICRASHLSAEILADAVPVYAGARALSERGVQSSLFQPNIENAPTLGRQDPLFHDPQTAGGLLAVLPPADAEAALCNMAAEGKKAWIIGRMIDGEGAVTIL
ncbi:hypothetical protein LCGC14_0454890 [marine sediment metagenome]|uniref:Selenide, water dikinase SelD n=2 Tax=root TaxID=1 RepID=A0A7V1BJ45_9RHOB|nr:selenide, water dikinase SelD [Sulfitobacter litoralis]HDY95689.1 selenide, water dikinase SelD [Sulfitobacter litoralis]HDZ53780.1 selenide, water dikinase SelD [Sulfitobacter litoralis]|tara:strand:+ start:1240 stop:3408 length:2169 start_codon:yes stop_codon:yes gene_type:complete